MKIERVHIRDFKRFTDLRIEGLPPDAKLVVLVGPNGTGKTSLFEAFNYWMVQVRGSINFDETYHPKVGGPAVPHWSEMLQRIEIAFHDTIGDPRSDPAAARSTFYFRSAYRHEPDLSISSLSRADDILSDSRRPGTLIASDTRVSDNYQRLVSDSIAQLFDPAFQASTAGEITERVIGRVRSAMTRVFDDLHLGGPGKPMEDGTFFFNKGSSSGYRYKNLSGGEKAAFDLLLDFVLKSDAFNNTVFCIDEPELHMHTKLQGRLLDELLKQLPRKCQLWISTHSIGMTRRAMELHRASPSEVVFLDFSYRDLDTSTTMVPATIDRPFWKSMFAVALDDLAELVAPSEIVFCEGRKEMHSTTRTPTFDAFIYRVIFGPQHPDTEFVPLGGTTEVDKDALLLSTVLAQMLPAIKTWKLFDRDDRSALEIQELQLAGTRVLGRRDLESYLWDDEVLAALAASVGESGKAAALIAKKHQMLGDGVAKGRAPDDVKAIAGELYNETKRQLSLVGCGNTTTEFSRATLAPIFRPGLNVYAELERAVFPP